MRGLAVATPANEGLTAVLALSESSFDPAHWSEGTGRFDPSEAAQFYARDEWPTILRRYANVDQDEADLARIVSSAVSGLAAGRAR